MAFKDLGLLVVDEEQRFGVKHKEQLKQLRTQVDVLTLTATPIPRTLHMSMSGHAGHEHHRHAAAGPPRDPHLRHRSSIRRPIREAIVREVQRGGQVFFVHNRVQSIHSMERLLRELVPEVDASASRTGRWARAQLEKVMARLRREASSRCCCAPPSSRAASTSRRRTR